MKKSTIHSLEDLNPFVRFAGYQQKHQWRNKYRRIYDHEYLLCVDGKAFIEISGARHDLHRGSLALVKPNQPHRLWLDGKEPGTILWIHFDFFYQKDVHLLHEYLQRPWDNKGLFTDRLSQIELVRDHAVFENGFAFPEYIEMADAENIERSFISVIRCFGSQSPYWYLEAKSILLLILKQVLAQYRDDTATAAAFNGNQTVSAIKDFISKNYMNKITIKQICKITFLSEDYLGKLFKKHTGSSIISYLTRFRIAVAANLLRNTPLGISDIAHQVGFCDAFHFSKIFKKHTGLSPHDFRNSDSD